MKRPSLLVIDPSVSHPETQGVEQVLEHWPGESRVLCPALAPGDGPGPEDGYDADGVVLLGSGASLHDDAPWLGPLGDWLRPIVEGSVRIPLLGICFGHQLVAHLAGGDVRLLPGGTKRVGIEESRLSGGRLVPGEARLKVVVSHREEVKTVPAGFDVVARRDRAELDGFEHERLPIFTFQFHPEARQDFLRNAGLDPGLVDSRLVEDSERVLAGFRKFVLEQTRTL